MKVSIIIPSYNEEKTIGEVIQKVKKLKLPIQKEIIVVDDGSSDNSFNIIKKIKGIKILSHEKNIGKGGAVKTALKHCSGDIFIIQDADLELNPKEISKVLKAIIEKKALVVYGSRNLNGTDENRNFLYYLGGKFISSVSNFLYGTKLTDEPCGYKAFKIEVIGDINIKSNGFEWEPEITAKIAKKGIKIHEVPVSTTSRSVKEGKKLRKRDGIKALWILIKYKFKN